MNTLAVVPVLFKFASQNFHQTDFSIVREREISNSCGKFLRYIYAGYQHGSAKYGRTVRLSAVPINEHIMVRDAVRTDKDNE